MRGNPKITWKQLSPIYGDVVLSPWNLLIVGLLIRYLTPLNALASIVVGYIILGTVFILYGGLGFKKRMQSAEIFREVFPGKFSALFIPLLLAFGQLGWAAINISLGGSSLAILFGLPRPISFALYAVVIGLMAAIGLYKLAYTKIIVILASSSLVIYIAILKLSRGTLSQYMSYTPAHHKSFYWGCSIVVASLISFATVSPDFFKSIKHKNDIARSTVLGIMIPGILICSLGTLFFFNVPLNLATLIASLSFAALPNTFNIVANTDGSMALYTPALKFELLFKMRFIIGIVIGGLINLVVALLGITNYLETWLKILTIISPIFIGVAFAALLFDRKVFKSLPKHFSKYSYVLTVILCIALINHTLPVIVCLVAPLLIYGLYLQYKIVHE
jgi:purine-cytosine permease-like protein